MDNYEELQQKFAALEGNYELLAENLNEMADKFGRLDWDPLDAYSNDGGLTLDKLKAVEKQLSDMTETSPLMKRGAQLRHGYVFGQEILFQNMKPAATKAIEDEDNERALFSTQGYEELNKARFCAGNVFVIYNAKTKKFTRVPLSEISALELDPESNERIQHIQREWGEGTDRRKRWYRVSSYGGPKRTRINSNGSSVPVDQDSVMIHETANKQVGWPLGVPDGLAAISWALAYSHYLNNNATLVRAYAQFAYKISSASRRGVDNAAAKVRQPGVGGTALTGSGNELTPVNATGSQVNFNNGQPIAAMVAASLGVSVIALISSPGAAGGSYGAAQTLDAPTILGMTVLQAQWKLFYKRIMRLLKSPDANVVFPNIENDAAYRQLASLANAFVTGAIHREEYREKVIEVLDILNPKEGLPDPDGFNSWNDPTAEPGGWGNSSGSSDPVARQGNSGAVPGGFNQGETNNDGRTDTLSGGDN